MPNLPTPAGPRQCTAAVATFTNADVRASALAYCRANWNSAKVDGLIARAAQWSQTNRVPIMAGGSRGHFKTAAPAARLRSFFEVWPPLQAPRVRWGQCGGD